MKSFNHSTTTNNDPKIRKLRLKFGLMGKAIYFEMLELAADKIDGRTLKEGTAGFIEESWDIELFSLENKIEQEELIEMLDFMASENIELIDRKQWFENKKIFIPKIFYRSENYIKTLITRYNAADFLNICKLFTKFIDFLQQKPDFENLLKLLQKSGTTRIEENKINITRREGEVNTSDPRETKEIFPPAPGDENIDIPSLEIIKKSFLYKMKKRGFSEEPLVMEFCKEQAERFLSRYKANGGKTGTGNPIIDWNAQIDYWMYKDIFKKDLGELTKKGVICIETEEKKQERIKQEIHKLKEKRGFKIQFFEQLIENYSKVGKEKSETFAEMFIQFHEEPNKDKLEKILKSEYYLEIKNMVDLPTQEKLPIFLESILSLSNEVRELETENA